MHTVCSTHRLLSAAILLLGLVPSAGMANALLGDDSSTPIPMSQWQVQKDDALVVDTQENVGYLVHTDGTFTSFPVATGQRATVRYIGRVYNATTPERNWTVRSMETKGDRTTFGKDGTFLRMWNEKDDEKTPYGIHSHASADKMLSDSDRFRSMGCVIVSDQVLAVIIMTYETNGEILGVKTAYGLHNDLLTMRDAMAKKE